MPHPEAQRIDAEIAKAEKALDLHMKVRDICGFALWERNRKALSDRVESLKNMREKYE